MARGDVVFCKQIPLSAARPQLSFGNWNNFAGPICVLTGPAAKSSAPAFNPGGLSNATEIGTGSLDRGDWSAQA
jgi:hypothetical protein